MKKYFSCLSAIAAFGIVMVGDMTAHAQMPMPMSGNPPAATAQPMRPRIALVNIAKVLREFQRANSDGQAISKKKQEYVDKLRQLNDMVAAKAKLIQSTPVPAERERIQKEAVGLQRQIEDVKNEAEKVLGDMTDKTIVDVYQNIKAVINDIAVTNNLDLVMCFPDASTPEDDRKPTVAQLKLQTQALIPFYHRNMDITEVVIVTLNRRHPAPPTVDPKLQPVGGIKMP